MSSKRETDPMMIHEYRKVVAKQIAADIYSTAVEALLFWEDYPELGEYDWEAIVEMVKEDGPAYPHGDERIEAWKGLVGNE